MGIRGTATTINLAHPTEDSTVTRTAGRASLLHLQPAFASLLWGGDEHEKKPVTVICPTIKAIKKSIVNDRDK